MSRNRQRRQAHALYTANRDYRPRAWIAVPLFFAVLFCVAFILLAQQRPHTNNTATTPASTPTAHSAQCGVTGRPACMQPEVFWASIPSLSTTGIIAAAKSTPMYQSAATSDDVIGYALQHGTPGVPVLVKPYRSDVGMPQEWVIPIVGRNNIPLALLTFVYDPVHQRLRASEFDAVTGNMFYTTHTFPFISAAQASTLVRQQRHTQILNAGASVPTLIYYPSNHTGVLTQQNAPLNIGGTAVIDPIWRVTSSDGQYYYVDHMGKHSYTGSDLSTDPAFGKMPTALTSSQ